MIPTDTVPNIKFLDSPFIISSFVGEKWLGFSVVSSVVNLPVEMVLFACFLGMMVGFGWCFVSLEVIRVGIKKGGFM